MAPQLEVDLKSIGEWSAKAAGQHMQGDHREALMNLRNVGETACRVILRVAWPGTRGEEAVRGSTYDLMLRMIQGKSLAPAEVVSALHVLRTRGNNADHARPIAATDSAGALFMLHALLEHVFPTLLQRRVPADAASALAEAISGRKAPEQHAVLKEVLREEEREQQERAPLVARLDPADMQRLEAEQESHRARIRDMEALVQQIAAREAAPAAPAPVKPAPTRKRMGLLIGVGAIALISALGGYFALRPGSVATESPMVPVKDSTVTTLLILPFAVMQDDPNLSIRFEQAIENRLRARIQQKHLALRVYIADTTIAVAPSEDGALAIARRRHADLVMFGELYEPTASDSGKLLLRFISTGLANWPKGDLGARAFRSLADSAAIRTQLAAQAIAELALANRLYNGNRPSDALAVLYDIPVINLEWTVTTHTLRARCHRLAEDYGAAMRELEAGLRLKPGEAHLNAYMGRVLSENGDHTAAIRFYEEAIAREPENAEWLMALAYQVGDRSRQENFDADRCRQLVLRALKADSTRAGTWELYGEILGADGRILEAREAFERAIALDTAFAQAKYQLANMLAVETRPPDLVRAEELLREAVRGDSSNAHALLLLAQIVNQGPNRDRALADRLFKKSGERDPRWEYAALVGRAKAAYNAHDEKVALALYQQAWAMDSSDVSNGVKIAVLHGSLGNEAASQAMLLRCYALDSMHHTVNLNLGIGYLREARTAAQRKPALFHLERALSTDPYDKYTLAELGIALVEERNMVRGQEILERLLKIDPDNHIGHGYLGIIHTYSGNRQLAIHHYERALATDPEDPIICGNLATLFLLERPPRLADARRLLSTALRQTPQEAPLHMSMCSALMDLGDYRQAADHYRQALALKPNYRSLSTEKRLKNNGAW